METKEIIKIEINERRKWKENTWMNKTYNRNSEVNKQPPRNIYEIFSCSWGMEHFRRSRELWTDISYKTVLGCSCCVIRECENLHKRRLQISVASRRREN